MPARCHNNCKDQFVAAGLWHTITWDATDLPSGVYFYRIEAGEFAKTRKMLLLK